MARELDQDELIERWTLIGDDLERVASKRSAAKLGFALLLKFFAAHGRFPRGRSELPSAAVEFVAKAGEDDRLDLHVELMKPASSCSARLRWPIHGLTRRFREAAKDGPFERLVLAVDRSHPALETPSPAGRRA